MPRRLTGFAATLVVGYGTGVDDGVAALCRPKHGLLVEEVLTAGGIE